jgi:hypothetical protein
MGATVHADFLQIFEVALEQPAPLLLQTSCYTMLQEGLRKSAKILKQFGRVVTKCK